MREWRPLMKSRLPALLAIIATLSLLFVSLNASPQKKKKKKADNSPPTVKLEATPIKDSNQEQQPAAAAAPEAAQAEPAAPQKKKKKKADNSPAAATPEAAPVKDPNQEQQPAQSETAAKEDPARDAWRIEVEPYAILGSGRPGKGAADFDKPDGVAFTPNGLLLATDAHNRRIQIWDVKTKTHLSEFGHGVFGGEIVDIAVAPTGIALITDQTLNLAYTFVPAKPGTVAEKGKKVSLYDYQFKGTRFGEQGFDKLGGIAIDSRGRIYAVDAHLNDVRRFNVDGAVDPSWKF